MAYGRDSSLKYCKYLNLLLCWYKKKNIKKKIYFIYFLYAQMHEFDILNYHINILAI